MNTLPNVTVTQQKNSGTGLLMWEVCLDDLLITLWHSQVDAEWAAGKLVSDGRGIRINQSVKGGAQ